MPVIGYLNGLSSTSFPSYQAAFRAGLAAAGYVEGRNVKVEYRWAESQYERLPALAADLARRQVAEAKWLFSPPSPFNSWAFRETPRTAPLFPRLSACRRVGLRSLQCKENARSLRIPRFARETLQCNVSTSGLLTFP